MPVDVKGYLDQLDRRRRERSVWDNHWQDIRDNLAPDTASFTGFETPGTKNRASILDSTAEQASQYLAGTMHAWLSNPGTRWFLLRAESEDLNNDDEVQRWLQQAGQRVWAAMESPRSRWHEALPRYFRQLNDFGTSPMFCDDRAGLPVFHARPLREHYVAEGDEGVADSHFRVYELTARQVQRRYPDRLPRSVEKALKANNPDESFGFLHVIEPRPEGRADALFGRDMPIASIVIAIEEREVIEEGGYFEPPLWVGRWMTRAGEVYGRGPGIMALPHAKMLNRARRATIRAAEKMTDPPVMMFEESVAGTLRLGANSVNHIRREYATGRQSPIWAFRPEGRPDVGEELLDRERQAIEGAYLVPFIRTAQDPRMTATQVLKLEEETLRLVSPFIGRQQVELLAPAIDRAFAMMLRAGHLGQPPAALSGAALKVEYQSPIVQAQRLGDVRAIIRWVGEVGATLAAGGDQDVYDNVDMDDAMRLAGERLGVPFEAIKAVAERDGQRQARDAAAADMAARQARGEDASAAQSEAQALAAAAGAARTMQGEAANAA